MGTKLNYLWRLFGTGFCFLMFGLGGLIIAVILLPLVWVLKRNRAERNKLGKRCVQASFRLFLKLLQVLGVADFKFRHFERIQHRNGLLVVANHPTLIDVICLVAHIDNADCVVKRSLKQNPATAGPLRAAGYLTNEGGERLIEDCVASIAAGNNLIIFPEGTRTVPGQPLAMQRGAANIALQGGFDICPVYITCTPSTLTKREKWYQIPPRKFTMELVVLDDICISDVLAKHGERAIAARKLTEQFVQVLSGETIENDRPGH